MKCPKCGKELTMWAQLTIEAPSKYLHKITKKAIAKKEFVIWSCDWKATTLRCHGCGYSDKGLSNYIDQLKKALELACEGYIGHPSCPRTPEHYDECDDTDRKICSQCWQDHFNKLANTE